jgi:hypothetical protein
MQANHLASLFLVFGLGVLFFSWINSAIGVYLLLGGLAGVLVRDFGSRATDAGGFVVRPALGPARPSGTFDLP